MLSEFAANELLASHVRSTANGAIYGQHALVCRPQHHTYRRNRPNSSPLWLRAWDALMGWL